MFMDSDDKISPILLQSVYEVIENNMDVDMIKLPCPRLTAPTAAYDKLNNTIDFITNKLQIAVLLGYTWSMIWRRDKIKNIRHLINKGMCAELPYNWMVFNECDTFYILNKPLYTYNTANMKSINKSKNPNRAT